MLEILDSVAAWGWELWAAIVAVIGFVLGGIRWLFGLFRRPKPIQIADESVEKLAPKGVEASQLSVIEFIRIRRELKADLEAELAEADTAEKDQLRARIAELESQIANPDEALAEAQSRIADLEAKLMRESNELGTDRIAEAVAAMKQEDYSKADALFAEIEERRRLEVEEAARPAV